MLSNNIFDILNLIGSKPPTTPFLIDRSYWRGREITDEMVEVLKGGDVGLGPLQNVASGFGFNIHVLLENGYFETYMRLGDGYGRYRITKKGRAYLEARRVADLAKIGVYEVHNA